ncbi:MAG: chromosome segregation protein SMC [Lachnospiraceae bacterium]|nr:chromosome segregation protein SMC [Lachnospiraceae bacterium]
MFLKSIEVQGFKSFANKLVFEFRQGITGIVGPNGSGKSNVADAVRWVLGEQSAKQLRGGNMQDVIFAGTETRKPQSFASVAITLDNSDHCLDLDYEEVTVTRRLYRSGESEYLINGSQVRLRDIHEIFYDTGIGKEGYSIIGQGQIDKILSGKAEERRELFDEAAGIVKFKRRKHATMKKLAEEEQNLLRVNDILSELTTQLNPLKEQSEKAKIYLDRRDKLKVLEINSYLVEETFTRQALAELTDKQEIASAELNAVTQELERTKSEYTKLEEELDEIDGQISEITKQASEHALVRQRMHSQIEIFNEQIQAVRRADEANSGRLDGIAGERKFRDEEEAVRHTELREVGEKSAKLSQREKELIASLQETSDALDKINAQIEKYNNDVIGVLNSRVSVKGEVQRYSTMREQLGIRKAEIDTRYLRLREEAEQASREVKLQDDALKTAADEIHSKRSATEAASGKLDQVQKELNAANDRIEALQASWHRNTSRHDSLKAMAENYEGYGNAIRKIMEQKRTNPGIRGTVADLVDVPEKYETAIETALGGSLRNIVTDNESTAKYLIEFLKRNKSGRATFLPLTSIKPRSLSETRVLKENGVIGTAASLVSVEPEYENLRDYLLGRTVIVEHIDQAIALGRKYHHSLFMVTLQGDSFSPGGSITGGAFRNTDNLLGRKREIEELAAAIKKGTRELDEQREISEKKKSERNALRDQLTALNNETHQANLRLNTAQMKKKQADEQLSLARIDLGALDQERREIERELKKAEEGARQIAEALSLSEDEESKMQKQTGILSEQAGALQEKSALLTAELEQTRVDHAACAERRTFLESDLKRIASDRIRLDEEERTLLASASGSADEIVRKEAQIRDLRSQIVKSDEQAATYASGEEALRIRKQKLSVRHREFFEKRDSLSADISRLDRETYRLNSQKERMEETLENQVAHLWEEYELTPVEAHAMRDESLVDRKEMKKQVSALRNEIRNLGSVNVNAIEDYKNVLERYEFLHAQHEDLVESGKTLSRIIEELDTGMRKQFKEKFADIQREFDAAFRDLFGGGRGTLELEENVDILDAGISITAHPPGKKLQNMMQLSGGEKALTAIALLFAIQNLKPSPFCLLDEIEAALDDNNVGRFAGYLHNLTKNTQFIVITHRRGTMTAADRLYGITMQEKGVSTLISVNLIENELSS